MTVAQELVKEPCKSNPRGLKCTKKLRRVLQSEMKDIPAIKRRAAINKRLKEIKSSSTTVVRGKARRKLKRSYAGNLPQPGTTGAAGVGAAAAAALPISQPFGQVRPDFERANTDRLNAAANAGNRLQAAYYAQQLGLTPSIRNNALNPAALALFPPANNNFQAQPQAPGAGVPQQAPNLAAVNAYQQNLLQQGPQQGPLPPAAPPIISQSAGGMGTPRGRGKPFPRPNIPPSGPPPGSIGYGSRTSGPVNSGGRGIPPDPSNILRLRVEQPVGTSYPRNPRPESKGDVENRRQAAGMGGVGRGERKKTPTIKKREEDQRLAEVKSTKTSGVRKTPTAAGPRRVSARLVPPLAMSTKEASEYNKSLWDRKGSSKDENVSIKKRIGKALFGGKYTKLKRGEVGKRERF